jgi:hypothetical protein
MRVRGDHHAGWQRSLIWRHGARAKRCRIAFLANAALFA